MTAALSSFSGHRPSSSGTCSNRPFVEDYSLTVSGDDRGGSFRFDIATHAEPLADSCRGARARREERELSTASLGGTHGPAASALIGPAVQAGVTNDAGSANGEHGSCLAPWSLAPTRTSRAMRRCRKGCGNGERASNAMSWFRAVPPRAVAVLATRGQQSFGAVEHGRLFTLSVSFPHRQYS